MQPFEPQVVYHKLAARVFSSLISAFSLSAVCAAQWLAAPLKPCNDDDGACSSSGDLTTA
jgi:hypothetical protein